MENEIAQSEGAFGKPLAKYWMHNGFVNINQEKMSKSLGNFLLIKDVIQSYHPEAIRLFLLSSHYRSPIDFTDKTIDEAGTNLDKIYALLDRMEAKLGGPQDMISDPDEGVWTQFCEAMDDDFNTARGVGVLFESVRQMNRLLDEAGDRLAPETEKMLQSGREAILKIGTVLGIMTESPAAYFDKKRSHALEKESADPAAIEQLIQERTAARKAKDWSTADHIRDQLDAMNVILEDRPDGTVWKMKS